MKTRRRSLPPGWYPADRRETLDALARMGKAIKTEHTPAAGGIVPHAGWEFSGRAALEVFLASGADFDTCVIVGGHMQADQGILVAQEDEYETPLGPVTADLEMLSLLGKELRMLPDLYPDNTVEIQLPMVKHCFPKSRALWLRASPSQDAVLLGKAIFSVSGKLGRKTAVFGSTDLTHYGSNYGFSPAGTGQKALDWVKNVNDKTFVDAICRLDAMQAVRHALSEMSACSAGGAAAAVSFAMEMGAKTGRLLTHYTSHDVYPMGDSFVGYAGIIFPLPA